MKRLLSSSIAALLMLGSGVDAALFEFIEAVIDGRFYLSYFIRDNAFHLEVAAGQGLQAVLH